MKEKNILLLGGNGYIGSRLYEHLLSSWYRVDNVDLCWFGKLYDETLVVDYKHLTKEHISKYSHIVLLAAHSSVAMCANNLDSAINNNVMNFIDIVNKISDDQVLIYGSTCAIYGKNSNLATEDMDIGNALNFYDFSKISTENVARLYPTKKIIGLRFGSVNGFSKNMRKENLLNSLTLTYLQNKPLILSNGDSMRSVLGLTDLCSAIETIIAKDFIKNKIYNITSVNDSILNFGKSIQKLTSSELIMNNTFTTDYSFYCSTNLFEKDYKFKFTDTVESIFTELVDNYDNIEFNIDRGAVKYV
jgi:nucleoside-diphosphate-sugar epimerase